MSIGIVSTSNYHQPESVKPPPPPPVRAEKENDSDKDDGATSVKAASSNSASAPTVNTLGQTIGSTISVTA